MKKESNTDATYFNENEILDLNSMKPFEFEPKTNMGDTSSSQKKPSEVFCNKKCAQKFRKNHWKTLEIHWAQACNFVKKDSGTGVFL